MDEGTSGERICRGGGREGLKTVECYDGNAFRFASSST